MTSFQDLFYDPASLLWFGIIAGLLSTFAYIPYIIDTLGKRTHPHRASWLIWSVLGGIAFFSQVYEGATASLWFAGVQVSGTITVFLLSIWFGAGGYLNKADGCVLICALAGLILWYFTDTAVYALAISITISAIGGTVTVAKAYRAPQSETMTTWLVSFVASILAIWSIGTPDIILLAYPLYLFVLNGAIVVAMMLGRRRLANTPAFG